MTGFGGHLQHLYEDPSLRYNELEEIIENALNGSLFGSEKIDGINFLLSFNPQTQQTKIARNQTDMAMGGISIKEILARFADKDLTQNLNLALDLWQEMFAAVDKTILANIFGPQGENFFNTDIVSPEMVNVIKYDKPCIIIHPNGHYGQLEDVPIDYAYKTLRNLTNPADQHTTSRLPNQVVAKPEFYLQPSSTPPDTLAELKKLRQQYKLIPRSTIRDFLLARFNAGWKAKNIHLTAKAAEMIVDRITGVKGITKEAILQKIPSEAQSLIISLIDNSNSALKELREPLERILFNFSKAALSQNQQSSFIADKNAELRRLKTDLAGTIKDIRNSGLDKALTILDQQLQKIGNINNIDSTIEGFVFEFKNKLYKLTGNFAPINQILGLYKYGRGDSLPALKNFTKESTKNRIIVLFPGSFKPPHGGHFDAVDYFSKLPNVNSIVVMVSSKPRQDAKQLFEITCEQSAKIWSLYCQKHPKVRIHIAKAASPVQEVYDFLSNHTNPGDTVILTKGSKDQGEHRFNHAQEWADKNSLGIKIKLVDRPVPFMFSQGSSHLRELISKENKPEFIRYLPKHLNAENQDMIWNLILASKMQPLPTKHQDAL